MKKLAGEAADLNMTFDDDENRINNLFVDLVGNANVEDYMDEPPFEKLDKKKQVLTHVELVGFETNLLENMMGTVIDPLKTSVTPISDVKTLNLFLKDSSKLRVMEGETQTISLVVLRRRPKQEAYDGKIQRKEEPGVDDCKA